MIQISIRHNFPRVMAALKQLPEKAGGKALVRAMNNSITQGKTEMARTISKEFRVTSAQVKYRLETRKASAIAGNLRFEAVLSASNKQKGRSMNLIAFAERFVTLAQVKKRVRAGEGGAHTLRNGGKVQKALQIRFQIKRGGGVKIIKGAFIGNKGRTMFIRVGKERLPISSLNTIDVPQMFNTRRINEVVVATILKRFETNFNRELRSALKGYIK